MMTGSQARLFVLGPAGQPAGEFHVEPALQKVTMILLRGLKLVG
jgi:hypothetical protein